MKGKNMPDSELKEVMNRMLSNINRLYQFESYNIKLGELSKRYKRLLLLMMEAEILIEELEGLRPNKEEDFF
jgi:hypothetical protein